MPLDCPEYVKIQLWKIPQEFIDEYKLTHFVRDGWEYFEIRRGCYGLPQSGMLAINNSVSTLQKRDITRHTRPQDYGATNGFLLCSTW